MKPRDWCVVAVFMLALGYAEIRAVDRYGGFEPGVTGRPGMNTPAVDPAPPIPVSAARPPAPPIGRTRMVVTCDHRSSEAFALNGSWTTVEDCVREEQALP